MNMSKFEKWQEIYNLNGVKGYLGLKTSTVEIVYLVIEPECGTAIHELPMDAVFFVVNGNGMIEIEGIILEIEEKSLIECKKNIKRKVFNNSDKKLEIVVTKLLK